MTELPIYTVLLIDDEYKRLFEYLKMASEAAGFEILCVDSVLEGIEYLDKYADTVHAILLDISFPKGEMQGKDALQKIRKSFPNLPVIILTGSDSAADIDLVVECMKYGAYNYVGKRTLNPLYLFQVLQSAIENNRIRLQSELRVATNDKAEKFFTIKQSGEYGKFKESAVFGFELVSVNKPADEKDEAYLTKSALEWHTNLLKTISIIYRDEIKLNLKYIVDKGIIRCYIIFTLYANDINGLELLIKNVQHDLNSFFNNNAENKNQPYLFEQIADPGFISNANQYPGEFKHTIFYRKAIDMTNERGMGFVSSDVKEQTVSEYVPDKLFPLPQKLSYDNELFRALQNQKEYTEIDVELKPEHLLKQEIDFIKQSTNNINSLNIKDRNYELIRLYSDYLQQFIVDPKDKFMISVVCKRKSRYWERHLAVAIENFFFGLGVEYGYRTTKPGELINRYSVSNNGPLNRLPFFYDLNIAIQAFRLPLPTVTELPGIKNQSHIFQQLPVNIPKTGFLLGNKKTTYGSADIRITKESLARHLYIMGQTGTGKSTLLKTMITDCLKNNEGFAVIDPHGDLFDDVLKLIPKAKKKKLIMLNPLDVTHSMTLNPLRYNEEEPAAKSLVINEMIRIFGSLYNMALVSGPVFESYFKNGLLLLMDEGVKKIHGQYVLSDLRNIFEDADFRNMLLKDCEDESVKKFFRSALRISGDQAFENVSMYITSKLTRFVEDYYLSPLITGKKKNIDFRKMLDDENILLVKMDKGLIGTDNTSLLGQIVLGNIIMAGMSRSGTEQEIRKPYNIFIDEFQNFLKSDVATALSEIRKYGLKLVLANQTLGQLDGFTIQSLLGNVGSLIFFRPGINDYDKIKHYLEPDFKREDVLKLPNFNCIARLLIDNIPSEPFVFQTKNE